MAREMLAVRLDAESKRRLKELADRKGASVSAVIRRALGIGVAYIEREDTK